MKLEKERFITQAFTNSLESIAATANNRVKRGSILDREPIMQSFVSTAELEVAYQDTTTTQLLKVTDNTTLLYIGN